MKKKILVLGVALVLLSALVVPTAALAETGESSVGGTVGASYSLSVPTPITLPPLVPNTTVESSAVADIAIDTSTTGTVTLTVRDKEQASHIGQLYCTAASYPLTAPLKVKCGTSATDDSAIEAYTALPTVVTTTLTIVNAKAISAGVTYNPAAGLFVEQAVEAIAEAGDYSLILYFEATFS